MISVYTSIVLSCFQWLFKSYISNCFELPVFDYIADYICELSYATCTRINAVGTKFTLPLLY